MNRFPDSTGDSGEEMMGQFRLLLSITGLCILSACADPNHIKAGIDRSNPSPLGSHSVSGSLISTETMLAATPAMTHETSSFPANKLIALTFDDGPRPYVLFGTKGVHPAQGLADILDKNGVRATFFVVGWRLTPKTWGEPRHPEDIAV